MTIPMTIPMTTPVPPLPFQAAAPLSKGPDRMSRTVKAAGVGAVLSLKISLANAVIHLQEAAETARKKGQEAESLALVAKANDLGATGIAIRRAEIAVAGNVGLSPIVINLSDIANQARDAAADLRSTPDLHDAASNLIGLNKRLMALFPAHPTPEI